MAQNPRSHDAPILISAFFLSAVLFLSCDPGYHYVAADWKQGETHQVWKDAESDIRLRTHGLQTFSNSRSASILLELMSDEDTNRWEILAGYIETGTSKVPALVDKYSDSRTAAVNAIGEVTELTFSFPNAARKELAETSHLTIIILDTDTGVEKQVTTAITES